MKAVVAAFNQEKALVGAFSVITNLRMEIFEALLGLESLCSEEYDRQQYPAAELRTLSHHRPVLLAAAAGPGRLGDFNARFRHGKFCQQKYYYMLRKKYFSACKKIFYLLADCFLL